MNVRFFKLTPAEAKDINPNTPCVMIWDPGHPAGPVFHAPIVRLDYARHIVQGSAGVANIDQLIIENNP
jgi:hypothetical protein